MMSIHFFFLYFTFIILIFKIKTMNLPNECDIYDINTLSCIEKNECDKKIFNSFYNKLCSCQSGQGISINSNKCESCPSGEISSESRLSCVKCNDNNNPSCNCKYKFYNKTEAVCINVENHSSSIKEYIPEFIYLDGNNGKKLDHSRKNTEVPKRIDTSEFFSYYYAMAKTVKKSIGDQIIKNLCALRMYDQDSPECQE